MRVLLLKGDNLARLEEVPEIGLVLTDPPYGLEFMGKEWDRLWETGSGMAQPGIGDREIPWPAFGGTTSFGGSNPTCATCGGRLRGSRKCSCEDPDWRVGGEPVVSGHQLGQKVARKQAQQMQLWHQRWLKAVYDKLVPGGYVVAFSGTRTFHRLAAAMEGAGFRDVEMRSWAFANGFPKSHNISKAIDRFLGNPRSVQGHGPSVDRVALDKGGATGKAKNGLKADYRPDKVHRTPEAAAWDGWGTALKPAWECVLTARKP